MFLPPQIETCQFLLQVKRKMRLLPRLLIQEAFAEEAGRPRECPARLDEQQVEDREGLENGVEIRLYELNDNRLP